MEYCLKYVNLGLRQKACLLFLNPPGQHFQFGLQLLYGNTNSQSPHPEILTKKTPGCGLEICSILKYPKQPRAKLNIANSYQLNKILVQSREESWLCTTLGFHLRAGGIPQPRRQSPSVSCLGVGDFGGTQAEGGQRDVKVGKCSR